MPWRRAGRHDHGAHDPTYNRLARLLSLLRIRNLALIRRLDLELGPGLNVLTGETGAGKSIILQGIGLISGQRADLDMIRQGSGEASAEAMVTGMEDLEPPSPAANDDSRAADQQVARPVGDLILRRTLGSGGSRAYVDDRLATVRRLAEIGERLVDVAGQNEQLSLRRPGAQLDLLDRFAGVDGPGEAVAEAWDRCAEISRRLDELRGDERQRAQREDWLRFQIDEIRKAAPVAGEDVDLGTERRRLMHAEELAEAAAAALSALYEDDGSVSTLLAAAQKRVERIRELDPASPVDPAPLRDARVGVEEAARDLQGYVDGAQADPARLAEVDDRLATLERLKRKYGESIAEVLEALEDAERELDEIAHGDETIVALEADLQVVAAEYRGAADRLGAVRRQAGGDLAVRIEEELAGLGMEGASFVTAFHPASAPSTAPPGLPEGASRRGTEAVEYLLSANPGESPRPLAKVASGGELSRVMLALKLAAKDGDPVRTLVFDEIDAGIGGGRVAERLAQRLSALATSHQILVVTHLPQVAAYADRHFRVLKQDRDGRSQVSVHALDEPERVDELARMLGGLEITDATRTHAREMLQARR